ncbi:uncharacterized protein BT62DRAFT_880537 [Guyanagaster necrorhizus]|uniref:PhoD-like phosphatase domain-containing protein n=1 Tax=Guyanagaster necrorhizus TaxID=856835 RepID=A0A9P7W4Z3_9AGAR|nr:uncharacterized protein BT62DRAFT_880537 [Guyanagaster necrorhizus MCA 3950]KAG7452679.1 hypothetical protein BT62DRAFT_880537 [Guyanagaster necrorhizus MCA 3950]
MDNAGWHAFRRAQRESESFVSPQRGPDGRYLPVEQITPMDEHFIGGFHPHIPSRAPSPAPPLPPKDWIQPGFTSSQGSQLTMSSSQMTHLSAIERSQLLRVARMNPHLQFMVGPLLRYDTVDEHGVWHGAALVVTADAGSTYEPHPTLTYEWDPELRTRSEYLRHQGSSGHSNRGRSFDLGPHPADPHSSVMPIAPPGSPMNGKTASFHAEESPGQEIWVYGGNGGTFTFWRFMIHIPLGHHEMAVSYSINKGQKLYFFVPGRNQNMRWAAYSCNGFSAGVNPDDFRGPGFHTGYDPVWVDLLEKHAEKPFHMLMGGGDQIYCDGLTREPELQEWIAKMKPDERKSHPLSEEISEAIDRFYFNHYCQTFRSGAFARANSSIPMMNMCDDHGTVSIIDGFGSYPDDLQVAPVFQTIGARGYFFFLLFQCFLNVEIDGINDHRGQHVNRSVIIGGPGPYVKLHSHSFLASLGPQAAILMLDCRAERKKDQVCSRYEYDKIFKRLQELPESVEHLIIQLGIPIAYPRMVFLESALESRFNPIVALSKTGSLGLSGFVNKFNADAELLDDLNDHWTARSHKRERNWLILELQKIALAKHLRITFVSGDVHCAAVGVFKTLRAKGRSEIQPSVDHRYMVNVVTSAIVNTPPPMGVITMVCSLASKNHRTLHHVETDETMLPLFSKDTDGSYRKLRYIMGRRNWCSVDWEQSSGDLMFDIRVEKEKGLGITVGYSIRTPPPRWN